MRIYGEVLTIAKQHLQQRELKGKLKNDFRNVNIFHITTIDEGIFGINSPKKGAPKPKPR